MANAEVSAKYDRSCREGPGLSQFDQVQYVGYVGGPKFGYVPGVR